MRLPRARTGPRGQRQKCKAVDRKISGNCSSTPLRDTETGHKEHRYADANGHPNALIRRSAEDEQGRNGGWKHEGGEGVAFDAGVAEVATFGASKKQIGDHHRLARA